VDILQHHAAHHSPQRPPVTGTASGSTLTFTEINPAQANVGEVFVVSQPSTQDVLGCAGTMASGVPRSTPQLQGENAVQLQLENQICSAINRGVLSNPANWTDVAAYYSAAPPTSTRSSGITIPSVDWPMASPTTITTTKAALSPRPSQDTWHGASAGKLVGTLQSVWRVRTRHTLCNANGRGHAGQ
jgi:Beta-1,3-glucanase